MSIAQMILYGWLGMALMMVLLYLVARVNKNKGEPYKHRGLTEENHYSERERR